MNGLPDFSKAVPRRLVTMSMADKYTAVCLIYDGVQYQNLCKQENPDGTFNYSEKCLVASLPYLSLTSPPFIGFEPNTSSELVNDGTHTSVVRWNGTNQTPAPQLGTYGVAMTYFPQVVNIILVALLAIVGLIALLVWLMQYFKIGFFRDRPESDDYVRQVDIDDDGYERIGKIKFNRKLILGVGSKGTYVYEGRFEEKRACAVKRILAENFSTNREIDFLQSLQHPNLVRYFATEKDRQFVYIALEPAEFTLRELVESKKFETSSLSKESICKQSALGLQYLHEQNIVHRDIKPDNILISFPRKPSEKRNVMITDFGLSKDLDNSTACHSSHVFKYCDGTQGWMAPEIIKAKNDQKHLAPSKSTDIFSLGCVFYYVIFEGKHPFGDSLEMRQANIIENRSVLNEFSVFEKDSGDEVRVIDEDLRSLAVNLVRTMIDPDANERPPINSILKWPLFWAKKDLLQFLVDVSDLIDNNRPDITAKIETEDKRAIFGFNWRDKLSELLIEDLRRHRSYHPRKVQDLLRVIRNKKNHYNEASEPLKSELGEIPEGFLQYFTSRFPALIPFVYRKLQPFKSEATFRDYYELHEDFIFT